MGRNTDSADASQEEREGGEEGIVRVISDTTVGRSETGRVGKREDRSVRRVRRTFSMAGWVRGGSMRPVQRITRLDWWMFSLAVDGSESACGG